MLTDAEKEAEKIISDAEKKAYAIETEARHKSEQLKSSTEAELKRFAENAFEAVKELLSEKLANLCLDPEINPHSQNSLDIIKILSSLASNPAILSEPEDRLTAHIPAELKTEFEKSLENNTNLLLKNSVTVTYSNKINEGFECILKDGCLKLSFTPNSVKALFKQFTKPHIYSYLFSDND